MKYSEVDALVRRAVKSINNDVSRKLTARLASEKPPLDARHVTDTRTRVSTLLEYALGYELNRLLDKDGSGHSVTAVLWNVFPDLLVRDATHTPVAGIEVKALHTAAEEKSANLATPMHSIRKGGDFLVILIWAWRRDNRGNAEIVYPRIIETGIFDAYLLAQIRDYSWLHNTGGRMKAFDVSTPLISSEKKKGFFKAEEGNMGKLMRIALDEKLPATTPNLAELRDEAARYERFKSRVFMHGFIETFREICGEVDAVLADAREPANESRLTEATLLSEATLPNGARLLLVAGGAVAQFKRGKFNTFPEATMALHLSDKLVWRILRYKKGEWETISSGAKPDAEFAKIKDALTSPM